MKSSVYSLFLYIIDKSEILNELKELNDIRFHKNVDVLQINLGSYHSFYAQNGDIRWNVVAVNKQGCQKDLE